MRVSSLLAALAVFAISASASLTDRRAAVQRCSLKADPSTCPKNFYCLAADPHNYCAKKLDGGKVCTKDEACNSDICFVKRQGKRVCASLPLSGYPLNAQCTQSKQCKSQNCVKGYCKKPAAAGESCPKGVGCIEVSKGAECLKKAATFVVYDSAGKKQTKKVDAGHCSYVRNLGEGMTCSSDVNCYTDKFTCKKTTKKCVAIPTAPVDPFPFHSSCSTDSQCESAHCVSGRCGCSIGGSDCDADYYCSKQDFTCWDKRSYAATCFADNECQSGKCNQGSCNCVVNNDCPFEGNICSAGVCQTPPHDLPYSQTCLDNSACASGACHNGHCACTADSESTDCGSTKYCDVAGGTCTDKFSAGTSCQTDKTCLSDTCSGQTFCVADSCVFSGTCTCSADSPCPDSAWCDSGSCESKNSYGGACTTNEGCTTGICRSDNKCGCSDDPQCPDAGNVCYYNTNTCLPKNLPNYEHCTYSFQCTSGKCPSGTCDP